MANLQRADIELMRAYDQEVEMWFAYLRSSSNSSNTTVTTAHCTSRRHSGKSPALWKLFTRNSVVAFVSRIEWHPADRINLRPWGERALLVSALDLKVSDDAVLNSYAGSLQSKRSVDGDEAEGMRWLAGSPRSHIRAILTSTTRGAPELWVRCPQCGQTELLTAAKIMADVRTA